MPPAQMPPEEGSSSRESGGTSRIPSWAAAHGRSSASSLLLVLVAGRHLRRSGPSHICWDRGVPFDLQNFPNQKQRRRARCRVASLSVAAMSLIIVLPSQTNSFSNAKETQSSIAIFFEHKYHFVSSSISPLRAREGNRLSVEKYRWKSTSFRSGRVGVSSVSPFFQRSKDHET